MKNTLKRNLCAVVLLFSTMCFMAQNTIALNKTDPKQPKGKYAKLIQAVIDSYDQVEGAQTLEQEKILHAQKTSELRSIALRMNIPIQRVNENGTISLLVAFLEGNKPLYYSIDNVDAAESTRVDHLNTGGSLGLNLNGDDLTAHVWDGGPIFETHQEFDGAGGTNRMSVNDGVTTINGNSFHAMHVTGTIGASGFQAAAKGMAWQANVLAHDWDADDVEARAEAMSGMLISNHSYGIPFTAVDTEFPYFPGQYNSNSTVWDDIMYDYPFYLMVKSAGNDGNNNGGSSPLGGNNQFDKLTGNANAKNNLVIVNAQDAVVDASGNLISVLRNAGSSEGPTDDLRVKPDVAGNGTGLYSSFEFENSPFSGSDPTPGDGNGDADYASISGTSMAAPNVAGTLLLLQEHNANVNGAFLRAATLKGLALHTADDVNGAGPDAEWGWGLVNGKAAAEAITNADVANGAIIEENTLTNGSSYSIEIQSDGINPLLASISWTDPAGTPDNSTTPNVGAPALVHDLDITLSNGSTFYPWRLTGVNTNSNDANSGNGNLVDPFERIDITAPAGIYTLTVSHKGTLPVAQDYSLIVTGANLAPSTPEISFLNVTGTQVENSECGFVDVIVGVGIANAPSVAATVTFTVGSGSGTDGEDFSLETSSLTFPTGTSASQNITVRVYHDSFIEGDETAVIDFTVNGNGGDATANTSADQLTLTITDDDAAHVASTTVTLYDEDIEGPTYALTTNNSGDGSAAWGVGNQASTETGGFWGTSGNATSFAFTNDDACNCDKSNDQLTTTAIDMSGAYSSATLTFDHAFANLGAEIGDVLVSTDGGSNFTSVLTLSNTSTNNGGGSYTTPWVTGVTVDMTPYIGQADVRIMFRYNDGGGWLYGMAVDNMVVTAEGGATVQTAVNTGATDDLTIFKDGTVYSSDAATGNVMATIVNNQSDDYGCTSVAVSRAGSGAQAYNGSVSPNFAMDKTFSIAPTNVIASGDTQVTFYFTEAEVSGWESATGLNRSVLVMAREDSGSIAETSAATVGAFGTDVTLTGDFTGLAGTYYFGNAATFVSLCAGVTKTWNGGAWVPSGAPGLTDAVIIDALYDTDVHGDINACSVTINTDETLFVRGGDFINVVGNITVNGTLQVDHTGSVVQTDDSALVTKGGSGVINVDISTPGLKDRDFVIMGSPLSGTTRETTLSSVWKVFANTPGNFMPHTDVTTTHGTTFADDNGDDWNNFASGGLTVGEGYIVRPVYDHGETPIVYDYSFNEGTLNNGVVSRPITFNGAVDNPSGTPNVYSNPYASAISTNTFLTLNTDVAAVYFWEHITHPSSAISGYHSINFDMDDISIYNGVMGTPAANDLSADMPTGVMSTGQGFGILATASGTVTFNNSMRVTTGNTEMRNSESIIERLLLNVRNDDFGVGSYAGVAFADFTTAGIDARYDTDRITTSVSLYSHLSDGSEALAIQSRELFDAGMQIPMGFLSQIEDPTEFTFSISHIEGVDLSAAEVMLLDTFTGITTNLSQNDYVFTSEQGQYDGRFLISFSSEVLDTEVSFLDSLSIYPNPTNDIVNIVSPNASIDRVVVYDMMGRKVVELDGANQNNVRLDLSSMNSAMYFVEINTNQGVLTKRIVKK